MVVRLALIGLFMIAAIDAAPQKLPKDGNLKMIILHNNDMHARFEQTGVLSDKCTKTDAAANMCYGGFARVATEVKKYRKEAQDGTGPSVLYLNAGDTYTGTPWFTLFKDEIASDMLNILKPDAISLGNHEFDEGAENLASFLRHVDFPVLAANLDLSEEPELQQDSLVPSIIREVDGVKIGIIGYLTPETKEVAIGNKVEFIDEVVAINKEAEKLKAEGINIIIALGHSGLERDKEIAAQCPEIDLVIGGHSHTFLYTGPAPDRESPMGDYPVSVTQPGGKKVPVVQAYAYTKYLGFLHLEFDGSGNLVEIDGTPILLDKTIERDPDVLELLEKYRPKITEMENEIVGTTKVLLDGNCRRNECNLGNFITDAFVDWHAMSYSVNEFWTDASISFLQGGGIRASINHKSSGGNITREGAATVMPFESKMEIIEITGEALLQALEHSVHRYHDDEARGEFLQMSGVHVVYDINKPSGNRVVEAKVLCSQCLVPEMEEIDEAKKYKIIMQDFLANGGDGFDMFKDTAVEKFDILDLEVFIDYMKKKSPIHPAVEWRVTVKPLLDPSQEVVGKTLVKLDHNCQQHECNLGNFITDAMVDFYATKNLDEEVWTDASIAVIQGNRIKATLDSKVNGGVITKSDAQKIFQPAFFNLNVISLTGDQIKKMLEHSVSKVEIANNWEFLQMSGLHVTFDLNNRIGERVIDVKAICAHCLVPELEPLKMDGEYKVIMQSVLAAGVDGYGEIFGTKQLEDLNESDANVFMAYLKKKSPVHPAVEWRITIKPLIDPSEVIVGKTLVKLDNNCRQHECNLGNFITDSMVDWHALHYNATEFWTDASIAVIQGNKVKTSIDHKVNDGVIKRGEAEKIFESSDSLSIVTLTGTALKRMLEHSISRQNSANNVEFLQMSGIQVSYDIAKPVGDRVTQVHVLCAQCLVPELEPLKPEANYKVIMQSALSAGADNYGAIFGTQLAEELAVTDIDAFVDYLKKKSPVYPAVEWRITILDQGTPATLPPTIAPGDDETTSTTTLGASGLQVSFMLILISTLLSFVIKR